MNAGSIVLVDWRDALPKEANKLRPAVVIEDPTLFDIAYPNIILVPLTDDARLAIPSLSVKIQPSKQNGCKKACYALAHVVTATSKSRVKATASAITTEQLRAIRVLVAESIGLGPRS